MLPLIARTTEADNKEEKKQEEEICLLRICFHYYYYYYKRIIIKRIIIKRKKKEEKKKKEKRKEKKRKAWMHAYGAYGPYVVRQAQKPCPQSLGCSPWKDSPGGTVVRISISRELFLRIIWASFTLDAFEEMALASRRTTEWGTCCMHVRNRRSNGRDEIPV